MTRPRILVTRRWPDAVEAELAKIGDVDFNKDDTPLGAAELRTALCKYDAVLPTVTDKVDADVLNVENLRAKFLGNYGVGFSNIDIDVAAAKGIVVTNTPEVLSECTADLAMALLLIAARRAGEGEREVRSGNWTGWRPTHMIGHKVAGKTLGIVGFGRIGREMARRAHFGFGMKIVVQDAFRFPADILDKFAATQVDSIEDLLPQSDFVSLHCPGGTENTHLMNAERLGLMKSNAILINTARGEVVDPKALADALAAGSIAAAALDVFEGEPNISPALLSAPNIVMLPHLGSATRETRDAMGFRVIDNLRAFLDGRDPRDRVN